MLDENNSENSSLNKKKTTRLDKPDRKWYSDPDLKLNVSECRTQMSGSDIDKQFKKLIKELDNKKHSDDNPGHKLREALSKWESKKDLKDELQ